MSTTKVKKRIEKFYSANKDKVVVAVFLDFSKAFETIDRQLLLTKLMYFGIEENALQWFECYLTYRRQRTNIDAEISSEMSFELGVPQGYPVEWNWVCCCLFYTSRILKMIL